MSDEINKGFNENQNNAFNTIKVLLIGMSYKQSEEVLFALLQHLKSVSVVCQSN